ncbi:growth hormone secretagogue receptor type 1-like [Syngnathus acus]|uniref:growth hormone secretagogue receptor type 1-like n=1 Tax=Syngnathus acus TaxID=161584 RepID=UPI0018864F44|nr:growth hormone secretagogue receptor type 1-like [Syngnathus acus]
MDLMMLEDMGSGCEDDNCGLASGFLEDCPNQDCDWNQPVFGFTALVCVTIIYIPVLLLGLLGNVLTILVVWLRPHVRSSTYLYLSSMAVSDLMILLLLPLDLYKLWRPRPWLFGDLACKMTMFLSECCTFCTILHITFLSLERYVAVCWPIIAKTLVTRRRTKALIGCLWLGAAVSAAPVLVMVGVEEVGQEDLRVRGWKENGRWMGEDGQPVGFAMDGDEEKHHSFEGELDDLKWGEEARQLKLFKEEESGVEVRDEQNKTHRREIINKIQEDVKEVYGDQQNKRKADEGGGGGWEANAAHRTWIDRRECRCTQYAISSGLLSAMMILSNLYFLVPVCILGLVYGMIGRTLWLRPQSSRRDQSHRHTVKMLGVIVMAFVLCWLPFHVDRTIFVFSLGTDTHLYFLYYLSQYLNLGSSVLYYLSAAVNPFLYNVMSARYRHAVHSLLRSQRKHSRTLESQWTTTNL